MWTKVIPKLFVTPTLIGQDHNLTNPILDIVFSLKETTSPGIARGRK